MTGEADGREGRSGGELARVVAPDSMQGWAELLVGRARDEGVALTGEGGLLTDLESPRVIHTSSLSP